MGRTNVVRPDGSVASVEEEQVAALEGLGYRRELAPEAETRAAKDTTAAYYDTAGEKAKALGEGVLGGLTLGVSEFALDDAASREREEHLPGWKMAGEVGGTVTGAVLTGGSGLVGSAARATPAGAAMVFGERVAAKVATSTVGRAVVSGGIEGGISGAGMTAAKTLTDNSPDTVESFMGEVGLGTVFGIGSGALVGGGLAGLGQVGTKAAQRVRSRLGLAQKVDLAGEDIAKAAQRDLDYVFTDVEKDLGRQKGLFDVELQGQRDILFGQQDAAEAGAFDYTGEIQNLLARRAAGANVDDRLLRMVKEMGGELPPTPPEILLKQTASELDDVFSWRPAGPGQAAGPEGKTINAGGGRLSVTPALDPNATNPGIRRKAPSPEAAATPEPAPTPQADSLTDPEFQDIWGAPQGQAPKKLGAKQVELSPDMESKVEELGGQLTAMFGKDTSLDDIIQAYRPPDGWSIKFDKVGKAAGARGGVNVNGDIIAPNGAVAGFISRTFRRGDDGALEVIHGDLQLWPGFEKHGVGPVISKNALEQYAKLGVDRVEIQSAMHIGRYYWMKQGYRVDPDSIEELTEGFLKWVKKDPELAAGLGGNEDAFREMISDRLTQPGGFADAAFGDRKIGKEYLLSEDAPSYALTLDLKPADPHYQAVKKGLGIDDGTVPMPAAPRTVNKRPQSDTVRINRDVPEIVESTPSGPPTVNARSAAPAAETPESFAFDPAVSGPATKATRAGRATPEPTPRVTVDTAPGGKAKAGLKNDAIPGDPMAEMVAFEKTVAAKEAQAGVLHFRQRNLAKVKAELGTPQGLQGLSSTQLVEAIERGRDSMKGGFSGVQNVWGKYVEEAGGGVGAGVLPSDIARLVGVPARLWKGLLPEDVPILAAWARLKAPSASEASGGLATGMKGSAGTGGPGSAPRAKEGRVGRIAGRAFKYLGGKALQSATGAHGFGVYALGYAAADAAWGGQLGNVLRGAKQATVARIDKSLARLAALDGRLAPAAVGSPVSAISAEQYAESSREIHSLAGAGGREALYSATANIRQVDPDLADRMIEDGMKRVSYLAEILPKPPPQGLFRSVRWQPSDVDRAKLGGVFRAVEDPAYAVEQMAAGRLTPPVAKAFRETSPALFAQVAEGLLNFATANPDAPMAVRRQVALMLGAPADELQLYTAQLQAAFTAEPGDMGPAVASKPMQNFPTAAQTLTEK